MSAVALPELRPAGPACVAELVARLGPGRVSRDRERRLEASRDHAWLSPVLTRRLPDVVADVVVEPGSKADAAAVLAIAHAHRVAVTARGKGTGNYGQAVPLAAGIVVSSGGLRGVIDVGPGWIHARAGTSFTRLEAAARATGQELAMFPSTTSSALGGFLAGGAGGTGSVENGFIWDGYVHELDLLPCWDVPEPRRVGPEAALAHLHAYGTTGLVTAARVALRPARRWTALWAGFADFPAAVAAGRAMMDGEPAPRNVSVDDAALVALLGGHPGLPAGRVSVRATVDESTVGEHVATVAAHGGTVELIDAASCAALVSLSFNHVMLRARRALPSLCHLQVGGPALVARHEEVRAVFPGSVLHLDGLAPGGSRGFGGLLLASFVDEATLAAGTAALGALGVHVVDAHTWTVGGHGPLAAVQAAARDFDPAGLLNPGKLERDLGPSPRAGGDGPRAPR